MNFNSPEFLIFLPLVVMVYWLLPPKARHIWLLAASCYFYMSWNYKLIILIFITIAVSYFSGLAMQRAKSNGVRKFLLTLTIIILLGLLAFFKYANFFINGVTAFINLFGLNIQTKALDIILPVGISFYTFQTLSYVVDVYRGDVKAETDFFYYALFVMYFPQLVAGPIERPQNLIPQLKKEQFLNVNDIKEGALFLLSGFIRKCVIADLCGIFVDNVYSDLSVAPSLAVFSASILFLVQMYCDFAGYSEIAMGAARLMGVKLTRNFNTPLISLSYTEFFRRWHITLNQWFTDYLYIPLGGNRKGKLRKAVNTLIVFLLCGLWHGASFTYVLWGLAAGVFVCLEGSLKNPVKRLCKRARLKTSSAPVVLLRWLIMILLFSFSAVLFRATSVSEIGVAFGRIFTFSGGDALSFMGLDGDKLFMLSAAIVIMALLPFLTRQKSESRLLSCRDELSLNYTGIAVFGILAVIFCYLALLSSTDVSGFQYFQF